MELLTEKYRPQNLSEIFGQDKIVRKLKSFVKEKNLPHLLFAGPAGTGKTTSALAIGKEIYKDSWNRNLLELNASDERGIDTIRTKVKEFARTKPIGNYPFKIILLDEADSLTRPAQQALRRMMERYSRNCRFILDCNFSSKIIDPIQSRCAVFRFKPISDDSTIVSYILEISKKEGLNVIGGVDTLNIIAKISDGDLRKAVNILQSCVSLGKVDPKNVYEIAGAVQPKELLDVLKIGFKGDIRKAMNLLMDIMINYGLDGIDIIKQIHSIIIDDMEIAPEKKAKLSDKIGEYEFRMVEGADEFLQLEALLAQMAYLGT